MASPFPDSTHKNHAPCALADGGFAEAAINRTTNEVEFSYSWDGVNWSTPIPVAIDIGSKGMSLSQESASGSDTIVLMAITADGKQMLSSDSFFTDTDYEPV